MSAPDAPMGDPQANGAPSPTWTARRPLDFDFDSPPLAPRDVVAGRLERGAITVLSGDTGAAKSILSGALVVAAAEGSDWIGRAVTARRTLVLDEENPERLVRARLRALGMTNDRRESLRYFNRIGATLGADDWIPWLRHEALEHRPDVVVIDTATAATAAEVNDNDGVARLYGALRPLAAELDMAIMLLHHERKLAAGTTRDPGLAMMGARQWAGQADTHMAIAVAGPLVEEGAESGHRRLRRAFTLRLPKSRDGEPDYTEAVSVVSEKGPARQLLSMAVVAGGPIEHEPTMAEKLGAVLAEHGDMSTRELAHIVGANPDHGNFRDGLKSGERDGLLRKVRHGIWGPPEATSGLDL